MKSFRSKFPSVGLDGELYSFRLEFSGVCCGGGGKGTNTVTKSDPWGPSQPHLKNVMTGAEAEFNKGPIYASTTNPLATLSTQTQEGREAYSSAGSQAPGIQNTMKTGLATVNDPNMGGKYNDIAWNNFVTADQGGRVAEGVAAAQGATTNYSAPTAGVNAADSLQRVLNGQFDPNFQAYMQSTNKQIADNIMQNKLIPQTMDALINGGYGGSSTANTNRAAAVEMSDAIGRNSNDLILRNIDNQMNAANIVTGAQRDASNTDISTYNSGVAGAQVDGSLNNENMKIGIEAASIGDKTKLSQAELGGRLAPTYDELQFGDAKRDMIIGGTTDARTQIERDTQIAREEFNKNAGWTNLNNYSSTVGAVNGGAGGGSSTSGGGSSALAGTLGGALTGASLASMAGGITAATPAVAGVGGAAGTPAVAAAVGPWGWAAIGAGALLGSGII